MNKNLWLRVALTTVILAVCANAVLAQDQSKSPPPFPPPPVQSLVEGGYLYVLLGPSVLQYKLPDLTLQKTTSLPAPEDSTQVSSGTQRPPMHPMLSMLTDGEYLYLVAPGYLFQYNLSDLELVQKQALPKPEVK